MQPLLAGNWKMNGSFASMQGLLSDLKERAVENVQLVVFPSFPYLQWVGEALRHTPIQWGAQTVCAEENGAYTGEVSATMLADLGCRFVIVGHSERRQFFNETDEIVAKKCQKVLEHSLIPILCVGENLAEKKQGLTQQVVWQQVASVLEHVGIQSFDRMVIAYEPIWAIGTGLAASPQEADAVHSFLRLKITEKDAIIGKNLRILYGGSLKASNAEALFSMPHIDGGLVGGASLNGKEFLEMGDMLVKERVKV